MLAGSAGEVFTRDKEGLILSVLSPGITPDSSADEALSPATIARLLTVIVPAYNEAASIADTVKSLFEQTTPAAHILVVDDCSSDDTGLVASSVGAEVITPPSNTGSKAGAQTFALRQVDTPFVMAIDADTVLEPDGIERLARCFQDPNVAAASGFVLPRHVRTIWERGRYVEYLFSFSFYKRVQDLYDKPLISSGCFSMYRTAILRRIGGWSDRTSAEDMDVTWTLYERGHKVRFEPAAVCYPIEPHDFHFLGKQLKRWCHGFVQNVRLHWRGLSELRYLRSVIAVAFFDAVVAPPVTLLVLPVLAAVVSIWFLAAYVIDLPVVAIPVLVAGRQRRESGKALASLPAYFLLRLANSWFMLKAVVAELVMRRRLSVYEKGH